MQWAEIVGYNVNGQLGDNTTAFGRSTLVHIVPSWNHRDVVKAIAAGSYHSIALVGVHNNSYAAYTVYASPHADPLEKSEKILYTDPPPFTPTSGEKEEEIYFYRPLLCIQGQAQQNTSSKRKKKGSGSPQLLLFGEIWADWTVGLLSKLDNEPRERLNAHCFVPPVDHLDRPPIHADPLRILRNAKVTYRPVGVNEGSYKTSKIFIIFPHNDWLNLV